MSALGTPIAMSLSRVLAAHFGESTGDLEQPAHQQRCYPSSEEGPFLFISSRF